MLTFKLPPSAMCKENEAQGVIFGSPTLPIDDARDKLRCQIKDSRCWAAMNQSENAWSWTLNIVIES